MAFTSCCKICSIIYWPKRKLFRLCKGEAVRVKCSFRFYFIDCNLIHRFILLCDKMEHFQFPMPIFSVPNLTFSPLLSSKTTICFKEMEGVEVLQLKLAFQREYCILFIECLFNKVFVRFANQCPIVQRAIKPIGKDSC